MRRPRGLLLSVIGAVAVLAATSGLTAMLPASAATGPRPVVTKLSVTSGPVAGGTRVEIAGTSFTQVSRVMFGSTAGTQLKVASSTLVFVTAPKHAAGTVNVEVVTNHGTSAAVIADHFTYVSPPAVSKVLQTSGSVEGGTRVEFAGTSFLKVTEILFGSTPGTSLKVSSSSLIFVTAPPATKAGQVDIRVVTAYGTSPTSSADHYTYVLPNEALTWSEPQVLDGSSPNVSATAVSCPTATFCVVVDDGDNVVIYHSGTWSAPENLAGGPGLNSVSCTSETFCLAGDSGGNLWRYDGANWTALSSPSTTTTRYALSCVSPTFCALSGADASGAGGVAFFNGSAWTPLRTVAGVASWGSLSCASSTFCAAVVLDAGGDAEWATYDGTSWSVSPPESELAETTQLTCLSATFCALGSVFQIVAIFNGKTWLDYSLGETLGSDYVPVESVSCASSTFCVADAGSALYTFDGHWWSGSGAGVGLGPQIPDVSCGSARVCVAVGDGVRGDAVATIGTR
jgi:hypothetical protein